VCPTHNTHQPLERLSEKASEICRRASENTAGEYRPMFLLFTARCNSAKRGLAALVDGVVRLSVCDVGGL